MAQQNGDDQKEIVITEQDAPPLTKDEKRILSAIFYVAHADSYVFNSEDDEFFRNWDEHWQSLTKEAKEIYYPQEAEDRFFAMEFYEAYDFGFNLHGHGSEDVHASLIGMLGYVEDQRDQYWESLPDQERQDWIAKYSPDARNECP